MYIYVYKKDPAKHFFGENWSELADDYRAGLFFYCKKVENEEEGLTALDAFKKRRHSIGNQSESPRKNWCAFDEILTVYANEYGFFTSRVIKNDDDDYASFFIPLYFKNSVTPPTIDKKTEIHVKGHWGLSRPSNPRMTIFIDEILD